MNDSVALPSRPLIQREIDLQEKAKEGRGLVDTNLVIFRSGHLQHRCFGRCKREQFKPEYRHGESERARQRRHVFTNTPNYSGSGGNNSTTGTFAGKGSTTAPLSSGPGPGG